MSGDVERTTRFYSELLEFPLTEMIDNRDYPGSSHFFFDIGNGNLLAFFDFPGLDLGPYAEVLGGLHHVAISVDPERWGTLVERLRAAGVEHEVHSGVSVYFRDPDGARIELIPHQLVIYEQQTQPLARHPYQSEWWQWPLIGRPIWYLYEKVDVLRALLHGYDYSGFLTGGHKTLAGAANHVLGIKDGKKRFADNALAMSKATGEAWFEPELHRLRGEYDEALTVIGRYVGPDARVLDLFAGAGVVAGRGREKRRDRKSARSLEASMSAL